MKLFRRSKRETLLPPEYGRESFETNVSNKYNRRPIVHLVFLGCKGKFSETQNEVS